MNNQNYQNEEEVNQSSYQANSQTSLQTYSIEEAMEFVGQRNKYQIYVTIASFMVTFITTYGYMVIPYFLSVPEFECYKNGKWEICGESSGACDSKIESRIRTEENSTISVAFKLFCDNRPRRVFLESIPLFAGIIGTLTFVYASNKFGRRYAIQVCWLLGVLSSFLINFSNSFACLTIGAFGLGFSGLILQILIIIQINEQSNKSFRVMGMIGLFIFWSVSEMQYIWMMEAIPNWKWNMFVFYTIPLLILMLTTMWLFHDSPRYLYLKDRAKCIESLNRIATFNLKEQILDCQLEVYKGVNNMMRSYLDLIRYPSQRKATINMSLVFLFFNLLYQGSQEVLETLGTSFGKSSLYVGIGEIIGFIISEQLADRIPRRIGIFYSLGVTSLIFISFYWFPLPSDCRIEAESNCWEKPFSIFMISFARGLTSITNGFQILMCGEIYPASMQSLGIGFNLAMGYLGTCFAPVVIDIANGISFQPIVLIGMISFVGNFCSLFQSESKNAIEQMDIPEIEEKLRKSSNASTNESNKNSPQMIGEESNKKPNDKNINIYDNQTDDFNISETEKVKSQLLPIT